MAVEVEFVGGPADGVHRVLDDDPYSPPKTVEVKMVLDVVGEDAGTGKPVGLQMLVYRRAVNPADEGPAWIYCYDGS